MSSSAPTIDFPAWMLWPHVEEQTEGHAIVAHDVGNHEVNMHEELDRAFIALGDKIGDRSSLADDLVAFDVSLQHKMDAFDTFNWKALREGWTEYEAEMDHIDACAAKLSANAKFDLAHMDLETGEVKRLPHLGLTPAMASSVTYDVHARTHVLLLGSPDKRTAEVKACFPNGEEWIHVATIPLVMGSGMFRHIAHIIPGGGYALFVAEMKIRPPSVKVSHYMDCAADVVGRLVTVGSDGVVDVTMLCRDMVPSLTGDDSGHTVDGMTEAKYGLAHLISLLPDGTIQLRVRESLPPHIIDDPVTVCALMPFTHD